MARRKQPEALDLPLFDLPLRPAEEPEADSGGRPSPEGPAGVRPSGVRPAGVRPSGVRPTGERPAAARGTVEPPVQPALFDAGNVGAEPTPGSTLPGEAFLRDRLRGGLADFAVQLLMLIVAIIAASRLGVSVTLAYWPPFAVLAVVFSFLYWVVPLAFWGQTPGMAWVGHVARSLDEEPLTFGQAARRWLGAMLTAGLAGLPLLLVPLGGRSLSDRLSGSKTAVVA